MHAAKPKPDVGHPIHPLIADRWSPRAFSDRPVAPKVILSLFEAARWTPSAHNIQPWAFVYGTAGTEDHAIIARCLKESNALWAARAPLMVLLLELAGDPVSGGHRHASYDVGQAGAFLTLQATAAGLYVHQMAGFDVEQASRIPGVPPHAAPMTIFAIGHLGDAADLPDRLRQREEAPQSRKPLADLVRLASAPYAGAGAAT